MIDNNIVKEIIHRDTSTTEDKISVIQKFIFDRITEEIVIHQPFGNIVLSASMRSQQLISDIQMMDYFFHCAKIYYKKIL